MAVTADVATIKIPVDSGVGKATCLLFERPSGPRSPESRARTTSILAREMEDWKGASKPKDGMQHELGATGIDYCWAQRQYWMSARNIIKKGAFGSLDQYSDGVPNLALALHKGRA